MIIYLFTDADMPLADENASMMDRLGKAKLEDLGLKATFQEILNFKTQDVIKLHVTFVEDTNSNETAQQRVALKQPPGVGVFQSEKVTSGLADLGEGELDTPYLSLVLEAKFTNKSQLLVQTRLFEWSSWSCENFGPVGLNSTIHHFGGSSC